MSNKKGALLTEEQRLEKALTKKKRRKIALRIFIGFLVILALFVGITTLISVIGVQSNIQGPQLRFCRLRPAGIQRRGQRLCEH